MVFTAAATHPPLHRNTPHPKNKSPQEKIFVVQTHVFKGLCGYLGYSDPRNTRHVNTSRKFGYTEVDRKRCPKKHVSSVLDFLDF